MKRSTSDLSTTAAEQLVALSKAPRGASDDFEPQAADSSTASRAQNTIAGFEEFDLAERAEQLDDECMQNLRINQLIKQKAWTVGLKGACVNKEKQRIMPATSRMGRVLRAPNNIVRAKTLCEARKIVCLVPPGTHRTKVITEKSELPPMTIFACS